MNDKVVIIRENDRVVFATVPMNQKLAKKMVKALVRAGKAEIVEAEEGIRLKQEMLDDKHLIENKKFKSLYR